MTSYVYFLTVRHFFVPANDHESGGVTNFSRWEQAFRVFSNIYMCKYPDRSSELIQYNHVTHTAALLYTWDNVYLYDRDFRFHLSRYPNRSWAVILQQAWTMRLKDLNKHDNGNQDSQGKGQGKFKGRKDVCWQYNAGHCSYETRCKFEHRCAICNKYGHGAHNCRRANGYEEQPKVSGSSYSNSGDHSANNSNSSGSGRKDYKDKYSSKSNNKHYKW